MTTIEKRIQTLERALDEAAALLRGDNITEQERKNLTTEIENINLSIDRLRLQLANNGEISNA